MKRTPLQRTAWVRRPAGADEARRATQQAVWVRAHGQCEWSRYATEGPECWGWLDVHEPLTRARGGSITDPDNGVLLCRRHHEWTHAHPREALELGLLRSRSKREGET